MKIFKNKIFLAVFSIYILITFLRVLNHQPWFDESRAWLIARHLNLFDLLHEMKTEGHTFIWYFLLMPFAKNNFAYPYSMTIMNWVFCVLSIFLLWRFAPFSNILKTVITFSFPFMNTYPLLARCYSVGILFLTILAILFKDKTKESGLFSFMVFLAANTSVMAMVGAFCFEILHLYELIKEKLYKKLGISLIIDLLCTAVVLIQLYNCSPKFALKSMKTGLDAVFFMNTFIFNPYINLALLIIFIISIFIIMFRVKRAFAFLTISFLMLTSIFHFVYYGKQWHHYFYYIYLLISGWIFLENEFVSERFKKALSVLLIIISLLFVIDNRNKDLLYYSHSRTLYKEVLSLQPNRMIIADRLFFEILPYFNNYAQNDIYFYPEQRKLDDTKKDTMVKYTVDTITVDRLKSILAKDKKNYIMINNFYGLQNPIINGNNIEIIQNGKKITLNLYKQVGEKFFIFEIIY